MLNNIYIVFKQTKIQVDSSKTVSNFEVCNLGLQAVNHVNRKKDFDWMEDNHQPTTDDLKKSSNIYT